MIFVWLRRTRNGVKSCSQVVSNYQPDHFKLSTRSIMPPPRVVSENILKIAGKSLRNSQRILNKFSSRNERSGRVACATIEHRSSFLCPRFCAELLCSEGITSQLPVRLTTADPFRAARKGCQTQTALTDSQLTCRR